ncbi:MAG TPA: hypothetical protein DIW24_07310 [Bacteroidetes bacterium]|nr:hypothetical protein [Bacteroidota bacterium]HRR08004.1 class I SAM-dependent methyltransferase [Rhodothermales bacterium]
MNDFQRLKRKILHKLHMWRGLDLMMNMYNDETGVPLEKGYWYASSAELPELKRLLKELKPRKKDALLDMGCGKGAALLLFRKAGFGTVEGVELSERLVEIARRNMQILRQNIFIHHADAKTFTDFDQFSHLYFFNPFPESVMSSVMLHVLASLVRKDRPLTILYYNPTCHETIMAGGAFRLDKTILTSDLHHWIYTYVHSPENSSLL